MKGKSNQPTVELGKEYWAIAGYQIFPELAETSMVMCLVYCFALQ